MLNKSLLKHLDDLLKAGAVAPEGSVFISFDADAAGNAIQVHILREDINGVITASTKIKRGQEYLYKTFMDLFHETKFISFGGDNGVLYTNDSRLDREKIEKIRKGYRKVTGLNVTVGYGSSMRKAVIAMVTGKLAYGKNVLVEWTPKVEKDFHKVEHKETTESKYREGGILEKSHQPSLFSKPKGGKPKVKAPNSKEKAVAQQAFDHHIARHVKTGQEGHFWQAYKHGRTLGMKVKDVENHIGGLKKSTQNSNEHYYHTTHRDNLNDIRGGGLKTFHPNHGYKTGRNWAPQHSWPDGGKEKRSYWSHSEEGTKPFSESGHTTIRVHRSGAPHMKRESGTGDYYSHKPIDAKHIEVKGKGEKWENLKKRKEYIPGGPAEGKDFSKLPQEELKIGTKKEAKEHTDNKTPRDKAIGREVAADHLISENPHYYTTEAKKERLGKIAKSLSDIVPLLNRLIGTK
jgi:hypothetical protein